MKFAVIEYTSKSGGIWRHTPERPNYLADPQKEIDPTSFGCYVSALEGEHIPITALVAPTLPKRIYRKLFGHWPEFDISYVHMFDVLMVVHQISDGHEVTRFVKRVKKEMPRIKVLGVPTQPYGILKDYWQLHPGWLQDFKEFIRTCDVFITITRSTKASWQEMGGNVEYLPQPYPAAFAGKFFVQRAEKEKIIFVAGRTVRDNIAKGLHVAKKLQQLLPEYIIHIANIDEPGEVFDVSPLAGARYEPQPFQPWQQHLKYLSRVALVINTDYTQTRGRVQTDCAAVGTPSIGADSDAQIDLFPAFPASREQPIDDLVEQGRRLLTGPAMFEETVNFARTHLDEYSYEKSARRVKDLVEQL